MSTVTNLEDDLLALRGPPKNFRAESIQSEPPSLAGRESTDSDTMFDDDEVKVPANADENVPPEPEVILDTDEKEFKQAEEAKRSPEEQLAFVEQLAAISPDEAKRQFGTIGMQGWVHGKKGGMKCIDQEIIQSQKGVVGDLLRSLGSAVIKGKSVINVSLPVRVFEPRSVLERISDSWCFCPVLLAKAALAPTPLERFQYVVTSIVSGLHRSATNAKPFNPILGETFQANYTDGTKLYMEQVSHHPPVTMFEMIGPNKLFHMFGHHEFVANLRPNSVTGKQVGPTTVRFLDGTEIEYHMPNCLMSGWMWGDREMNWMDKMHFVDRKNALSLELAFNPDGLSGFSKWFSKAATVKDTIRGDIMHTRGRQQRVVSRCEGSWLFNIKFDDRVVWRNLTVRPFVVIPHPEPLPSDSRFRQDLQWLKQGDLTKAQAWKETLEQKQRVDRKLRKQFKKIQKNLLKQQRKRSSRRD